MAITWKRTSLHNISGRFTIDSMPPRYCIQILTRNYRTKWINELQYRCYMFIQMTHVLYSVVIPRQSNPPISKFSRPVMNSRVSDQCSTAIRPHYIKKFGIYITLICLVSFFVTVVENCCRVFEIIKFGILNNAFLLT